MLTSTKTNTPYSILLHGEWGSGKSSLLQKTKNKVDKDLKPREDWKTLWFDAWEYEKLDPTSALLSLIADKFQNKNTKFKELAKGFGLFLSDVALRSTAGMSVNEFRNHFNSTIQSISTIKDQLKEMIGSGRLIVFIDDLDRCMIDNVLTIMEAVKLFLNVRGTIFIFAVDKTKVERAWELRYKTEVGSIEGREHIGKIFQLRLSLPPKSQWEIENYVKEIASSLPPKERELIVNGCPPNPRKLKRILSNIYFLSQGIPQDEFKKLFPFVVVWGVLANEFPEIAKLLHNEPRIFVQILLILSLLRNFEDLRAKMSEISILKQNKTNLKFKEMIFGHSQISPSTITAFEIISNDRIDIFNFLKAAVQYFNVGLISSESLDAGFARMYKDIAQPLREIIYQTGLVGVD